MKVDIVVILCKLEKIFLPVFFDIMVHLVVYLPQEAEFWGTTKISLDVSNGNDTR